MIFYEEIYSFESESNLLAKRFHKIILIHHQKRFYREFGSETFLQKSRTQDILHRL